MKKDTQIKSVPDMNKNMPFRIINFNAAYEPPKNSIKKNKKMIEWGDKNNYPKYLTHLYNYGGSSNHKMIIDKKVNAISGQGFEEILDPRLKDFVEKQGLTEEIIKIAFDYEIFNGFAFEIIWNKDTEDHRIPREIVSLKHIHISQLREGLIDENELEYFWYCPDWTKTRQYERIQILKFNPNLKHGRQIYYYSQYNVESILDSYPIPSYSTCVNSIETDHLISKFHLNQVKQGYSPSFILNFATGHPGDELAEEFYDYFQREYSGPENTGKVFITYSKGQDAAPALTKVDLNTSDERFKFLKIQIDNDIVRGSGIPPQLALIIAGKLGSTAERAELMKEFQQTVISPRQNNIEMVLNNILKIDGYTEKLILKKYTE